MKVLVTGATGFVGGWLIRDLLDAGHEPIAAPPSQRLDLRSNEATEELARIIEAHRPVVVAHLAAVSFPPDVRSDPSRGHAVTVEGTAKLLAALSRSGSDAGLLVSGSSEVYGAPDRESMPLSEHAPLLGISPYAKSKLEQEAVALAAARSGRRVVVTRAFNHTGPGQRDSFVAPALASRVLAVRDGRSEAVRCGNLDVERDVGDVRDVVRAYRLLLEAIDTGRAGDGGTVFNVATGRPVSIRWILGWLWSEAGLTGEPIVSVDESLVRPDDPPQIVGSAAALEAATGWRPLIPLEQTLGDLLASLTDQTSD